MTLAVGIRCTDGVVIGTDSSITLGSGQLDTIEQPLRQKIDVVEGKIIVAGTGEVGLNQRFKRVVKQFCKNEDFQEKDIVDVGCDLAELAIKNFFQTHLKAVSYGALVALPCRRTAELVEFGVDSFQPEVKTKDNWYTSMGSGQIVADPLLGFIRTTFWGDDPPSRQDGIFATTMVLELGCEMAPGGVAQPIQMAVLSPNPKDEQTLSARRLHPNELLEHRGNVRNAIKHFKRYKDILHDKSTRGLPKAPRK